MSVPSTMRAAVLTGHGDLDRLEVRDDIPVPFPAPGEVLVEVHACGINNTDINTRTGWYARSISSSTSGAGAEPGVDGSWSGKVRFPLIQGADPVGRIVEVGETVDSGRVGERVLVDPWIRDPSDGPEQVGYLGSERDGGYAEYVAVPSLNAHAVTSDLTDVELASFPCSYSAAENMLDRAGVSAGQWVLVTGASGGVGGALIQLAKRRGAMVLALTSAGKFDAVAGLGADEVIDRRREDLRNAVLDVSGGIDVFADVVGGELFPVLLETVRRGGHYTTAGAIAGPIVDLDLRTLYLNDLTMHGATTFAPEVFVDLVGYIERGEIRPVVAEVFPLDRVGEAQSAFLEKGRVGAIVLTITD